MIHSVDIERKKGEKKKELVNVIAPILPYRDP